MGGVKKLIGKVLGKKKKGAGTADTVLRGSKAITGIDPGDAGSNVAGDTTRPRPGRRNRDTPLGPMRQRL